MVPISGFYEWLSEDGQKVPHHVVADGEDGLLLAALWDRWSGGREPLQSFTLVTTEAHPALQWLHHRQPVMLDMKAAARWLTADASEAELLDLCAPALPVPLAVAAADTKVNNARFKDAACLEPAGPVRHLKRSSQDPS